MSDDHEVQGGDTATLADMDFDEFMDEWPCRICGDEEHMTRVHLAATDG